MAVWIISALAGVGIIILAAWLPTVITKKMIIRFFTLIGIILAVIGMTWCIHGIITTWQSNHVSAEEVPSGDGGDMFAPEGDSFGSAGSVFRTGVSTGNAGEVTIRVTR